MHFIRLAFVLMAAAGGAVLQIFLSKAKSKGPGLVLPIVSFCVSLVYVFNVRAGGDVYAAFIAMAVVFLLCNIPTAILLAIYAACRGKLNNRRRSDSADAQAAE